MLETIITNQKIKNNQKKINQKNHEHLVNDSIIDQKTVNHILFSNIESLMIIIM